MINFENLSYDEQQKILQQAREIVEQENLLKNAIVVYRMKKKDLIEEYVDVISNVHKIKHATEKRNVREKFVTITNYLFKINIPGVNNRSSVAQYSIHNDEEWQKYKAIADKVKNLMIECKMH